MRASAPVFQAVNTRHGASKAKNRKRRHAKGDYFTTLVTENDFPMLRALVGARVPNVPREASEAHIVDIAVYDPSGGVMAGQMWAVIALDGYVHKNCLAPHFAKRHVHKATAAEEFLWRRLFTRVDL